MAPLTLRHPTATFPRRTRGSVAMANKYNPFRPDKAIPPGMFCGRIEELGFIDHCLLQTKGGNPQHFLIEGERGIGKSSLLLVEQWVASGTMDTMARHEKIDFIVVSISLQEQDDHFSVIRKIAAELRKQIHQRNAFKKMAIAAWDFISRIEAGGIRYNRGNEAPDESELLSYLQADLVAIASGLDGVADGILLLIDEADKPPSDSHLGLICKSLTEELSRRGCERVCIGLAGLPSLLGVLKGSHESSPRIFRTMELKPLTFYERRRVIDLALKEATEKNGFEVKINDEAANMIANLSEGYPHFLQEFGYYAFEEDEDNVITDSDVRNSLFKENGSFDQLGRKYFSEYYQAPSSDDYRKILDVMADHLDDPVSRAQIIAESKVKVDNALRSFCGKNVILKHEIGQGQYRLPTKSFAVWIKARSAAAASASPKQAT
jgi:hypothetical protein